MICGDQINLVILSPPLWSGPPDRRNLNRNKTLSSLSGDKTRPALGLLFLKHELQRDANCFKNVRRWKAFQFRELRLILHLPLYHNSQQYDRQLLDTLKSRENGRQQNKTCLENSLLLSFIVVSTVMTFLNLDWGNFSFSSIILCQELRQYLDVLILMWFLSLPW